MTDTATARTNPASHRHEKASRDVGEYSTGAVLLCYDGWRAVMAAMDGDDSQRDEAFDALQRWAPPAWLEELDEEEERLRRPDVPTSQPARSTSSAPSGSCNDEAAE